MSDFNKAYKIARTNEGDLSLDKNDTGNYFTIDSVDYFVSTRYGQTFSNWLTYSKEKAPTTEGEFEDLKDKFEEVTKEDVRDSFKVQYWDEYNLEDIENDAVASNVFDAMINQNYTLGGPGTHETLSNVLNSLGYQTTSNDFPTVQSAVDAVNKAVSEKGETEFNAAYADQREKSYMGSKSVKTQGKGWLQRINQFRPDEDQYSKEELNRMSFTNDSISNIAFLEDLKPNADEVEDSKEEPTTESEGPTLKESPLIGEVDTEGVPIEATAKADKRYSRDISNRKIERKEALDKFRDEFIALSKTDPRKKSMGGTGEGGTKNILAFDNKMEQLLLDNPIAVLLSDNWDGKKEALMLTEDFFEGKLTSLQEDVLSKMIEDRRSYGKLFDKVYNDFYFSEGAGGVPTGDAINRLNEVSEYENNPPKLNIISTADGKIRVKLSDGRVVAVDKSDALTERGLAYNTKEYKDNLIKEGEEANKERMKGLLDSTGSYDEDGKLITQEGEVEKEKTKQTKIKTAQAEAEAEKRNKKIRQAEGALTGLKAAAGLLSLSEALRAPDVKTPELDPLILEALQKQKELSKSGLTAQEKGAAMQNMSDAYAGAMKNVLRASGGQRGLFLANQGTVDSNRIQGLNQLAAQDAAIRRENVKEYNQLASSVGQMKLNRDMNVEQMKQATLNNNRQILSGVGSNLLSDAISDVSYYMNPNRQATEDLIKKLSGKNNGEEYTNDLLNTNIGTASTNTKGIEIDAKNVDNNKNKTEG